MIVSDLLNIFQWWLLIFGLGILFSPITFFIFQSFFDYGYALSKIVGILFISYISWFLASLGLVPFNEISVFLIILLFLIINRWLVNNRPHLSIKNIPLKVLLIEEFLFLGGLIVWGLIKAHEPSIHGLEKYMDYGFMNSILRSDYMPPRDLWYTPLTINYYYFGHFWAALLMKISFINPDIGYNLILSTIFGLSISVCFSLGANLSYLYNKTLKEPFLYLGGILSAFIVNLAGNLHPIYLFFQSYTPPENPIPFWQLPLQIINSSGYWYPNATRFIPNTIHEFPIYSYVVSDLHGHVLNIPFVLVIFALLLKIYHQTKEIDFWEKVFIALLLAVFLMTNVLDGPIYLLITILVLAAKSTKFVSQIIFISFVMIVFSLLFWADFKPFASGVGVLCAPKFLTDIGKVGPFIFEPNHCDRSPLWMLFILWGFFYSLVFGFIYYLIGNPIKRFRSLDKIDQLLLLIILGSSLLIIIPEFFYAKDIYPQHYRANTVFKLGYQAFILLGLISGFIIVRLIQYKKLNLLYFTLVIFFSFLVAIYPYFAISSYFNRLQNYQSLNGLNYLYQLYPDDHQAILWLRENIKDQPVIVEAQGDSYTDYTRVSSNTGLPTILGWPVHEWLWRGTYDISPPRISDIQLIYESQDLDKTRELLKRYTATLVFIGELERQKYPNLNRGKFDLLGEKIFESGQTRVYRITLH